MSINECERMTRMRRLRCIFPLSMRPLLSAATLSLACLIVAGCTTSPSSSTMNITSSTFADGGMIPSDYTCDAAGIRPDIQISGVPSNAQSLALVLHDPDAPNGTFVHWVVWNIDPITNEITGADPLAGAVQGLNGAGKKGYYPPCPPTGTHHYVFTLYALSDKLTLSASSDSTDLETAMQGKILTQATLTGLYARTSSGASSSSEASAAPATDPGSTVTPAYD